ncbi:MAG: ribosomal RNA small subunit methyltransferase A [Clostridiales bacterium]|nr:ribosomal RNA small subunit methyltransferase A [Candidatus Apopatousia equi]
MENVLENLKENNFVFKKKFGQNFITDTNLLKAIVDDAKVCKNDEVLEIGTGAGTLTKELAKNASKVLTLEIDRTLKPILTENFKDYDNIELCFADFMMVGNQEVNNHFEMPFKVVANLPYYITTPIIFKLIKEKYNVYSITIMVQKEVAERLVAKHGTKEYGAISARLQAVADVNITRIVSKKMFTPMPSVDSAVVNIELKRNKFDIKNIQVLDRVIEVAFSMRRKTLSNCLKSKLNFTQEMVNEILTKMNLKLDIRGEALSVEQFVELANIISELK